MKALSQTQISTLHQEAQAEFEANRQKLAELEAKQAELQRVLHRFQFHKELVGTRSVPDYAPWLPFSH